MREEKQIRKELKNLNDEHLRRMRDQDSYSPRTLIAMIGVLEWVLGDKESLPDIA